MKLGTITRPLIELLGDAGHAEKLLDEHDEQFYRRSYIRSTMAAIEGIVWLLKQACITAAMEARAKLTIAEFAMLSDATYDLKNNGDVRTQTKFLKLPDNLRFAIATCNRVFGTSVDLQIGTTAWHEFQTAIAVRNRITHPKSIDDLNISDDEIATCKRIVGWFNERVFDFVDSLYKQSQNAAGLSGGNEVK